MHRLSFHVYVISILSVVISSHDINAAVIYKQGTPIPHDHIASTGIFREFFGLNLGNLVDPPDPEYNIRGINSPELFFQRTFDFAAPSNFRFDGMLYHFPEVPNILHGEPFLLGYLTYTNGLFFIDTFFSDIFIQTHSPNIDGAIQTVVDQVVLDVTENNSDPEQSADIVYFSERPELGSMRVYENQAGRIEVIASIGSLNLVSFGNVVSNPGSAFFFPTLGQVPIDFVPSSTGDGSLPPPPPSQIPEPGASVIWITSMLLTALGITVRNRLRNRPISRQGGGF